MLLSQISGHTVWAKGLSSTSVVLDLGANLGRFSHGIVNQFQCRCYAVEANPALCQRIEPDPRIVVFNLAVASTSGTIPLYLSTSCVSSSILGGPQRNFMGTIEVQAVSLHELLQSAGLDHVDLIKFDIEGAEIQVLESCSDEFLRRVPQLTIEFHDFLGLNRPSRTPRAVVERAVCRLQDLGFFAIKMWRRAYGDTLFINRRLTSASLVECLEARYITRNWWGLKRIISRNIYRTPG
jgi:FkbM family methyltransferase